MIKHYNFKTIQEACQKLAISMADEIKNSIKVNGKAFIALSGGKTPKIVFKYLSNLNINWKDVVITLTDERWVGTDHSESNEKMIRDFLLNSVAQQAQFIPMFGGELSPELGLTNCLKRLRKVKFPLDFCYLGIGADGHFASLFPNDPALEIQGQTCVSINANDNRLPRMSLSKSTILNSKKIFILFSGPLKNNIYNKAKSEIASKKIPLSLLLSEKKADIFVYQAP